jgi:hypothetical protein
MIPRSLSAKPVVSPPVQDERMVYGYDGFHGRSRSRRRTSEVPSGSLINGPNYYPDTTSRSVRAPAPAERMR